MREPEVFNYKGYEIVFLDYSNLKKKEEIEYMVIEGSKIIRSKLKSSVRSLVNMENMFFNNDIRNIITENVKMNNVYIKSSAVYGLKGLISIMFKSFVAITGRNIKTFNTKEEALEYLCS